MNPDTRPADPFRLDNRVVVLTGASSGLGRGFARALAAAGAVLAHVAPRFPQAAYTASKAGLLGLTRDLAQEWSGRKGIRVNALCPGYFDSEMTRDQEPLRDVVVAEIMLGRFGEQRELDAALIFLASPASSYVTGTSLLVDGGLSAL